MYIHVCIKVKEIKKGQITSGSSASQFKREWIPRTKNKSTLAKTDTYLDIINVILQFLCYTCLSWPDLERFDARLSALHSAALVAEHDGRECAE